MNTEDRSSWFPRNSGTYVTDYPVSDSVIWEPETMLSRPLVIMAWHVLELQMEKMASR
jgi:hypothetical protein